MGQLLETAKEVYINGAQASVNVTNALTAAVTTFAYTPTNIVDVNIAKKAGVISVPPESGNRLQLQFLLNHATDAEGATALVRVYGFKDDRGGVLIADLAVTGGAAVAEKLPGQKAIGGTGVWHYADTITESNVVSEIAYTGPLAGDGIYEAKMDLCGARWLFFDFDCDGGAGTDSTDCIALISFY